MGTPSPSRHTYDLVVVGSGAGGMTAAVVAAKRGAKVLVLEKGEKLGGTTARSGARLWIPRSRHARAHDFPDSIDAVRQYIQHEAGSDYSPAIVDAFIENGPAMVEFLEERTALRFSLDQDHSPDYSPHAPGASPGGRTIFPVELDVREIGDNWSQIAPFRRWGSFLGIQIGAGPEHRHFLKAMSSARSFVFVAREIVSHATSIAVYGRPRVLRDGNALIGRLMMSAVDAGVEFLICASALDLVTDDGAVVGVRVEHESRIKAVFARSGVILASGGVGHNALLRESLFEHVQAGAEHRSAAAPGVTGDGISMAMRAGASIRRFSGWRNAAWAPMMQDPRISGTEGSVPSFTRAVPGTVVVSRKGVRVGSETDYYPDFLQHMFHHARNENDGNIECFVIGDHRALRRYGLGTGVIKPFPFPLGAHLRSGLLVRGRTLDELSEKIGIDKSCLKATVEANNRYAETGVDTQFHRGESPFTRNQRRNPFLGKIISPPFYGVRIVAGDIGSFAGIRTDQHARALDGDGIPIKGLYAVGSDMASPFGGDYPGKGGNIGPAMTFAYIAAHHIALEHCGSNPSSNQTTA